MGIPSIPSDARFTTMALKVTCHPEIFLPDKRFTSQHVNRLKDKLGEARCKSTSSQTYGIIIILVFASRKVLHSELIALIKVKQGLIVAKHALHGQRRVCSTWVGCFEERSKIFAIDICSNPGELHVK